MFDHDFLRHAIRREKDMDIAAMSMQLSSAKIQQSIGISVAKKAMDSQETEGADLIKMMDTAAPGQIPASAQGQIVDVTA